MYVNDIVVIAVSDMNGKHMAFDRTDLSHAVTSYSKADAIADFLEKYYPELVTEIKPDI
jgi:hypothetical protein